MKKSLILGLALFTASASANWTDWCPQRLILGTEQNYFGEDGAFYSDTCAIRKHSIAIPGVTLAGLFVYDVIAEYKIAAATAANENKELSFGEFFGQYLKNIGPSNWIDVRDGKCRETRKLAMQALTIWALGASGKTGWGWFRKPAAPATP